jgi:hypothetical protein
MQKRWKLSLAQRADMWNRWKAGQSLHAIGRALGKEHNVIYCLLARHGGIAPPVRRLRRECLRWRNAKTSRGGLLPASRFGPLPNVCSAPCQR